MNIVIKIDDIDRTRNIDVASIMKTDKIGGNSTFDFRITREGGNGFIPETGQEIEVTVDGAKEFGGTILLVKKSLNAGNIANVEVKCSDYTNILNRHIATKRYEDTTVNDIIDDLISEYIPEITTTNVNCTIAVKTIVFDKMTISECLAKLASMTNYSWFVDYDKDLNFFSKYDNASPFNLTDTNGNYLQDSLNIEKDLSQLRNRVIIKGGEVRGDEREEAFDGDGTKDYFRLANKFAEVPTVKIGGDVQVVGLDFINNIEDYDCLWDYNGRYLRFRTAPVAGTDNITASGIPLYPIVAQVQDEASIDKYGVVEFYKEDLKIKSREEGRQFAIAELDAYSEQIFEGSFSTYTNGLRAGQVINIKSEMLDVNEDFLIQQVSFTIESKDRFVYRVGVATLRTVGIIDFLINQLLIGNRILQDRGDETLDKSFFLSERLRIADVYETDKTIELDENMSISESFDTVDDDPEFVYAPYIPTSLADKKASGIFDIATWH